MVISKGKNQYVNNEFAYWQWSAPVLQTPEEVMNKAHELQLVGRVVRDIQSVGTGYGWSKYDDEYNEDLIGFAIRGLREERATGKPSHFTFSCGAQIDDPMLIAFEDGDILGIDFSEGSCVRMELNTIPWDILPSYNAKNFHANRLFRDMLGGKITAVEVAATTEEPMFTGSFGLELNRQPAYVESLRFRYASEASNRRGSMLFSPVVDYGDVELFITDDKPRMLSCAEVLDVVQGFYTPGED